jgi:hypothetical protein
MGLQTSKIRASAEGCGVGGPYATAPPPLWLRNEHCPKVECERRYSWSRGDRQDRGCRLARIRRQLYLIVPWLEQRRICITRDEAADDRLTMDLREECRQVGGFPNIRVMEIADLSLERSSPYEDDGLRKHVALRHELSGDGLGSLALGGGPDMDKDARSHVATRCGARYWDWSRAVFHVPAWLLSYPVPRAYALVHARTG